MSALAAASVRLSAAARRLASRFAERTRDDRGDVPGWVLITLMTAGLVLLLWGTAGPLLQGLFQGAIARVGVI